MILIFDGLIFQFSIHRGGKESLSAMSLPTMQRQATPFLFHKKQESYDYSLITPTPSPFVRTRMSSSVAPQRAPRDSMSSVTTRTSRSSSLDIAITYFTSGQLPTILALFVLNQRVSLHEIICIDYFIKMHLWTDILVIPMMPK